MLSQKRVVINVVDTGRQKHLRKFPYFRFVGYTEVIQKQTGFEEI
jgi:hypothetical protein